MAFEHLKSVKERQIRKPKGKEEKLLLEEYLRSIPFPTSMHPNNGKGCNRENTRLRIYFVNCVILK